MILTLIILWVFFSRFNENCEGFGYVLFDNIKNLHESKPSDSHLPYEINHPVLFEKFLKLFELKIKLVLYYCFHIGSECYLTIDNHLIIIM